MLITLLSFKESRLSGELVLVFIFFILNPYYWFLRYEIKIFSTVSAALFAKAGSGAEVSYNKGLVAITQGNYGSAISNMSGSASANLALAKLLNGDANGAKTTLMNAGDDSAISSYLLAICCARLDDAAGVKANVNAALTKDGTLRGKAQTDLEFANFRTELGL